MKNYKAHILVVDDDDGIRNLVKKFLNEKSFLVNTANSAEEAQKKIAIIKFDLIILDIMMPGKSGLEFLNENKSFIDTPVILLTAKGEPKERAIDVIITRLRKKIEMNPKNPKYLQTIRGTGYVLWIE